MTTDYLQPSQPDILEVISNLSSDEVFTPPKVANAVLDLLPPEVWTDPTLRWLDPGCKTGIFPREITKRLMVGLADIIPDEGERLHHILTEMVFSIAITDLTGMMSRRTLYCSKDASNEFSAVRFPAASGNIWHERVEHSFDSKGRCSECGGTEQQLELPGRDNYAYGFIHSGGRSRIEKEIGMKFDVIVGNPPYQMDSSGDGTNSTALYDTFVKSAKALGPKYLSMIIPSRWMASGFGLGDFRDTMLSDTRIRKLVDFAKMDEIFPGVDFEGGVCYFLWERDNPGSCESTFFLDGRQIGPTLRKLDEHDVFVRDPRSLEILKKVERKRDVSLSTLVSSISPFGIPTNFKGYRKGEKKSADLTLYMNEGGKRVQKFIDPVLVKKGQQLISGYKVLIPEAYGERGAIPARVLGPTLIIGPRSVSSHTFIAVGPFDTKAEAASFESYVQTKFFRFLVSLRKITQHSNSSTYKWVPKLSWDREWTDGELFATYGITTKEQSFIAEMVKEWPQ